MKGAWLEIYCSYTQMNGNKKRIYLQREQLFLCTNVNMPIEVDLKQPVAGILNAAVLTG